MSFIPVVTIRMIGVICFALLACQQQSALAQTIGDLLRDGQSRWVQFQVIDGRIRAQSPYFGRFRTFPTEDMRQRLTIGRNMAGVGEVRFDFTSDTHTVKAEATESGEVRITYSPQGKDQSTYRSYLQPARGAVVLTFGPPDDRKRLEAASVWHLLLEYPEPCSEHFYRLLDIMRDGWNWDQNVTKLKDELFELAKAQSASERTKWAELVEQLASDRFVERQRAERLLRGYGRAAVPYLQSLDRTKLDEEQNFRIQRIVLASYGTSGDTPGRAAARLVGDPRTWIPLLASDSVEQRRLAFAQLKDLVEDSIEFSPEAAPEIRAKQITMIRRTLAQ